MFDFEKLTVYQKAKDFNKVATSICLDPAIDRIAANQLKREALSIPINIAESIKCGLKKRINFTTPNIYNLTYP